MNIENNITILQTEIDILYLRNEIHNDITNITSLLSITSNITSMISVVKEHGVSNNIISMFSKDEPYFISLLQNSSKEEIIITLEESIVSVSEKILILINEIIQRIITLCEKVFSLKTVYTNKLEKELERVTSIKDKKWKDPSMLFNNTIISSTALLNHIDTNVETIVNMINNKAWDSDNSAVVDIMETVGIITGVDNKDDEKSLANISVETVLSKIDKILPFSKTTFDKLSKISKTVHDVKLNKLDIPKETKTNPNVVFSGIFKIIDYTSNTVLRELKLAIKLCENIVPETQE